MSKKSSGGGKPKKAAKIGRSSKSGQFINKDYAKKHPSTTTVEEVRPLGSRPGTKGKS